MCKRASIFLLLLTFASVANATLVEVRINGEVEFNQISTGPLSGASSGDAAQIAFLVDSDQFVDSINFPVRGYEIITASFSFSVGGATVGMDDPVAGGFTPYFVVRDNDPVVDGFFLGTDIDGFPNGIPSDAPGVFGPFTPNFSVSYGGDTLSSLDILANPSTYDFFGLMSFNLTVDDGPFNAMGLLFSDMTISAIPLPAGVWLLMPALLGLLGLRRR